MSTLQKISLGILFLGGIGITYYATERITAEKHQAITDERLTKMESKLDSLENANKAMVEYYENKYDKLSFHAYLTKYETAPYEIRKVFGYNIYKQGEVVWTFHDTISGFANDLPESQQQTIVKELGPDL